MNYSALKPGAGNRLGDWSRLIYLLGIAGSIAAAAWYLDDRTRRHVARDMGRVESRLGRLEERLEARAAELAAAVGQVNRRLDRLIELQLELRATTGR